jgi:signal transduction histidine kinase
LSEPLQSDDDLAGSDPADRELPGLRARRSLAARIVALVTLVLLSSGWVAYSVVDQMRSLRARFDLLTGVYVPFQERLADAHVRSAQIAAAVADWDDLDALRGGDLLNLSEALSERAALVHRAAAPLAQGLAFPERIGGEEQVAGIDRLHGQVIELEHLVRVDTDLDPADVVTDARRQDEIGRAFRSLEAAARRAVRTQRESVRIAAREAQRVTVIISIVLGIAALLATLFVIVTLRPLRRLPQAVRKLAAGEWGHRIPHPVRPERDDEVGRLAREFNHMAEALEERERKLIQGERLAAIGQMAAQITHEIRNPLSSVALSAELLEDELAPDAEEARDLLARITGEVDRLTGITETYLRFSRRPRPELSVINLSAELNDLLDFLSRRHEASDLKVNRDIEADACVQGDSGQLRQAFMNLVRNAAEAALEARDGEAGASADPAGDLLEGSSFEVDPDHQPQIWVRLECKAQMLIAVVRDNGRGIDLPADARERVFEAFFTQKAQGTGLGLPMVQQIASDHGGSVSLLETGPQGTAFELRLPACDPQAASVSSPGPLAG